VGSGDDIAPVLSAKIPARATRRSGNRVDVDQKRQRSSRTHRVDAARLRCRDRNGLIERFLTRPSLEWILFVDSDMTPEPETTCRLLSHNVDIVGALYYSRDGHYMPMYGELQNDPGGISASGLRKVDWVGTGCMLIRRKVLEAMQPPYMEFLAPGLGEDVFFCRKARQLGFGVYVDTAHCVGHMAAAPIDAEAAMLYRQLPRVQALRRATYGANGVRIQQ
jgi:GT2 family glycosyltransferase